MDEQYHIPVMLKEVNDILRPKEGSIIIDCTLGGGGHSYSFLEQGAFVIGIDRDMAAIEFATSRLKPFEGKFIISNGRFSDIKNIASEYAGKTDGVIMDLGVSSKMLDDTSRGFSYASDSPLLMTMETGLETAGEIINTYPEKELTRIFREYGEEKFSSKIARAIVEKRKTRHFTTTSELSNLIEKSVGGRMPQKSKARIFQALRIYINDETGELGKGLAGALDILKPGGKICVISYHSIEDRIVKTFFREKSAGCICPPGIPICRCGHKPEVDIITKKPVKPSVEEIGMNIRSRSALMRAAAKRG